MSRRVGRNVPKLEPGEARVVKDVCRRHGIARIRYALYVRYGKAEMQRRCLLCTNELRRARYRASASSTKREYPAPRDASGRVRKLTDREKVTLEILEGLGK